jgi:hypothetical protein
VIVVVLILTTMLVTSALAITAFLQIG